MKKINENMKVTLTLDQLRRLVKESTSDFEDKIKLAAMGALDAWVEDELTDDDCWTIYQGVDAESLRNKIIEDGFTILIFDVNCSFALLEMDGNKYYVHGDTPLKWNKDDDFNAYVAQLDSKMLKYAEILLLVR